ncbi:cysteine hydrolase family protein [Methylobrevis pamukkalensis]|uniref:Isochorismatase family protein n=1 Tax=Methylobrevis pamukkalensis TaxID=1439726 RepID=A0A1E3H187_9HYPH|nr:Isochorismatase family protein [Methylobrevis pamukkalensis]
MSAHGVVHGPIGENAVHLCVDMQRLFGPGQLWAMPWLERVVPTIETICAHRPERTVFTRFIPAARPGEGRGSWARYYRRWASATIEEVGPDALRLVPALERFVPPAAVVDKHVYSPWLERSLDETLAGGGVDTLVITGGETDVCVLATALGAIDRGFRVILVANALCSSSDETHDALMKLYLDRFTEQVEVAGAEEVIAMCARDEVARPRPRPLQPPAAGPCTETAGPREHAGRRTVCLGKSSCQQETDP